VYRLLELVNSAGRQSALLSRNSTRKIRPGTRYAQFLQVAVSNVVSAPIWHCIELNTVGKLHLVLGVEPLKLLHPLGFTLRISCVPFLAMLYSSVIGKFVLLEICDRVSTRWNSAPSSCQPCRGQIIRVASAGWATGVG
jgi:hypothetical protein